MSILKSRQQVKNAWDEDVFHIFAQGASGEDGASPTLTRFEVAHPFAPGLQAARPIENIESCFAVRNGANRNTQRCELW
jgi:hypothetical protein